MSDRPKYSLIEFERRWLVNKEMIPDILGLERIEITDKYFPNTRMRLREKVNVNQNNTQYKLTKKYGKISTCSEPLTTIYLTLEEFNIFNLHEGYPLKKSIYKYPYSDNIFLIEFFKLPETNFILAEAEASSEKELSFFKLPDFISHEVTNEKKYEGFSIASEKMHN